MRIGLNFVPEHSSPEEWAQILRAEGCRATTFPADYRSPVSVIDAYVKEAEENDILIAEVGIWNSPFAPEAEKAAEAAEACEEQLRLADYVKARCCVNVSGSAGRIWYGCYPENFSREMYERNVEFIRGLLDRVRPVNTFYTLEPMQWLVPDSPEQYLQLLKDVDRERFAVHMDMCNFVKDPYIYTHQKELIDRTFDLLGTRIRSCHLKDCLLEPGTSVSIKEVMPGTGTFDMESYFGRIEQLDPDMPVLVEHLETMDEYRRALAYVRGKEAAVLAERG